MADIFPYLTLAFSAFAALLALLVLLGFGRKQHTAADPAETVRTEADRIRSDGADQARGLRQEIGASIERQQASLEQRLDAGVVQLRAPVDEIKHKLDADIAKMGAEAGQSREVLRATIEGKLDSFGDRQANVARDLRTDLVDSFARTTATLSQTIKDQGTQQQERLDKVAAELKGMTERQASAQETLRLAVEGRLDALRTENAAKLDEMRQTVDEKLQTALEKRLTESFRTVTEQLERVHLGLGEMQTLATGVGDLKRVLSNVKTRGTWGEVQLGMLLEQFLSPDQYVRNAQVRENSLERVEYAVRFSGRDEDTDLLLPIDAKFPQEDYERLVQAIERADAAAVEEASAALEARIKLFAKTVSEKYINPPVTTDFAILFLPTESLFAEALRRPSLFDFLQRDCRVTLAGPTTLAAMLSAFQMGFRSLAIQKRSSEVWQILGAVRTEFQSHGKVVDSLKKQLNTATNTIDKLGTRTRAMNRALRNVEVMPGVASQALLGLDNAEAEDEPEAEAAES